MGSDVDWTLRENDRKKNQDDKCTKGKTTYDLQDSYVCVGQEKRIAAGPKPESNCVKPILCGHIRILSGRKEYRTEGCK